MPSNCQILSLKKKVKELSDREKRDRTKTANQVFWLQLLCFSILYYKPLVLHFWSPYWLEIKCLAKIDWYIGNEAYCPSAFVKFAEKQNRWGTVGSGKYFLSGAVRHLKQVAKAAWLLWLYGWCQFESFYRSLVPLILLAKPGNVVNFCVKRIVTLKITCEN